MKNLQIIFNDRTVTEYKFVDNIIGELMCEKFTEMPHRLLHNSITGSSSFSDIDIIDAELRAKVEKCRNEYNIDMPHIPEYLDRETFNRVHEAFHVIDEKFSYEEAENNQDLVYTLVDINNLVHTYEHELFAKDKNSKDYIVICFPNMPEKGIFSRGDTPLDSRYRKFFKYDVLPHEIVLSVGYNTVGKNFSHAMFNNDLSLIRDNLIRPQVSISAETVWSRRSNWNTEQLTEEDLFDWWKDEIKKYVTENNLQKNIGYEDDMHLYTIQPVYAYLDATVNNPSDDEWKRLFKDVGIERFEIV
jgi:hypothetical protein